MESGRNATPVDIPDHELIKVIGSGSYGEVWLAKNIFGVYRAVKIVRRSAFKDEKPYLREFNGLKRFEPISRRHESLLDILHVGQNETQGYFYCVMELGDDVESGQHIDPARYEGKTLAGEILRHKRLPLDECIRIGIAISAGLREMHSCGLIHRDIKPANIVFINDVPKLADIGLVHSITSAETMVGTQGYIPPEGPGSIEADIFALGKVLYELSTGNDRQDFPELPDIILHSPEPANFAEFNEVLVRACESQREKRYHSADELRADLALLQSGASVRRLRRLERQFRFARKAAAIVAVAVILFGAFGWTWYREHERAERAETDQAKASLHYGARLLDDGDLFSSLNWFLEAMALEEKPGARSLSHRTRVASVLRSAPHLAKLWWMESAVNCAEMSPDGRVIAAAMNNGFISIFDRETGTNILTLQHGNGTSASTVCFNQTGDLLVSTGHDNLAVVWSYPSGRRVASFVHTSKYAAAAFAPNTREVLTLDGEKMFLWDIERQQLVRSFSGHRGVPRNFNFSPDGSRMASAAPDGLVLVWDVPTGRILKTLPHPHWAYDVVFSPDGKWLATACFDRSVRLWNAVTGEAHGKLQHDYGIQRLRFSPDGMRLAAATFGFGVWIWDVQSRELATSVLRHPLDVQVASFSPDSRYVITSSLDASVRLWDLHRNTQRGSPQISSPDGRRVFRLEGRQVAVQDRVQTNYHEVFSFDFSVSNVVMNASGSHFLATGRTGGECAGFDSVTRRPLRVDLSSWSGKYQIKFADNQPTVCVAGSNRFEVWNVESGERYASATFPEQSVRAAVSADGRLVAVFGGTNVYVLNGRTGERIGMIPHTLPVSCASFSDDGQRLVTGCKDNTISGAYARVWDVTSGKPLSPEFKHRDGVVGAAFSPDGRHVATGAEDFSARVWEITTGKTHPPFMHRHQITSVSFAANGEWLITTSYDHGARVWHVPTSTPITPPLMHFGVPARATFVPERSELVVTIYGGWEASWNLRPDENDQDALSATAGFLAGAAQADTTDARKKLQHVLDSYATPAGEGDESWHVSGLDLADRNMQPFSAQFHLQQLIQRSGPRSNWIERLGRVQAQAENYAGALETFASMLRDGVSHARIVGDTALLEILVEKRIRRTAAWLEAPVIEQLNFPSCGWSLALCPDTTQRIAEAAEAWAKTATEPIVAAACWSKAGQQERALPLLAESKSALALATKALVLARMGRQEEARQTMESAGQLLLAQPGTWRDGVCFLIIQREFAALAESNNVTLSLPSER